jgi:hypothetical protein
MKVKDVIKNMQSHNPEDEIVILYWTKDIFDDEDNPITDDLWSKVVKTLDETTNLDFANQVISEEILEVLREYEVSA